MTTDDLLDAADAAAFALRAMPGASISIGYSLTLEQVREVAKALEGEVHEQVYLGSEPTLIFAIRAKLHGVGVQGQGSRPATAEDVRRLGVTKSEDRKLSGDEAVAFAFPPSQENAR